LSIFYYGGLFVKLGQVASTRSDLLPPAVCDELAELRSGAEPAPMESIRPQIEAELGLDSRRVERRSRIDEQARDLGGFAVAG
jgi:predicted unusual protein kinase regulating ubiquinone biosynthesis (AarF/ABC1/UbiB family)